MASLFLILTAALFHFTLGGSNASNAASFLLLTSSLVLLAYNPNRNPDDQRWLRRGLYFQFFALFITWCIEKYLGKDGFWFLDDRSYFEIGRSLAQEPIKALLNFDAIKDELGSSDIGFYLVNASLQFLFGSSIWIIRWFNLICLQFLFNWAIELLDELQLEMKYRSFTVAALAFLPSLFFWALFDLKDSLVATFTMGLVLSGIRLYDRVRLRDSILFSICFLGIWNTRNYTAMTAGFMLALGFLFKPNGLLGRERSRKWKTFLILGSLTALAPASWYWFSTSFWTFFVHFAQTLLADANANSTLTSIMAINTPIDLVRVAAVGIPHLLFAPIPWQTAGIESWMYLSTFFLLFFYPAIGAGVWRLIKGEPKQRWAALTVIALVSVFGILWGGGSIRHRFQVEPFFIIFAGFGFGSARLRALYRRYVAILLATYAYYWEGHVFVQTLCILPILLVFQRLGRQIQKLRCEDFGETPHILQITNTDFSAKHLLFGLLSELRSRNWDVTVSCPQGPILLELEHTGIHICPIPFKRRINIFSNFSALLKLTAHLLIHPYDVVHVHTPIVAFLARIASFFACAPRVVYTIHGFYFHDEMPKSKRQLHVWLETVASWLTDLAFSQSQEDVDTAIREGIYESERIHWIGNGVDLKRFDPSEIAKYRQKTRVGLGIPSDAVVFITNCRIVREKGALELIDGFCKLKQKRNDVYLILVGETLTSDYDGYAKEVETFISKHDLSSSIRSVGYQPDIRPFLSAADVFVLNSRREGMPRSILEAMAAGLPVAATNIRGCREEVVHGKTGLLYELGNTVELQEVLEVFAQDSAIRNNLGKAGRERARNLFNESDVLARQCHLLEKALSRRARRLENVPGLS